MWRGVELLLACELKLRRRCQAAGLRSRGPAWGLGKARRRNAGTVDDRIGYLKHCGGLMNSLLKTVQEDGGCRYPLVMVTGAVAASASAGGEKQ